MEPDSKPVKRRPKRPVLMVHGVNSGGEWHDDVAGVLRRFFEPVPVRYRQYRWPLGFAFVIFEPWLVLAAVLVLAGMLYAELPYHFAAWAAVALLVISMLPSSVAIRRRAALTRYQRVAGTVLSRSPHVIAHSFGTYLTARLLEEVNTFFVRRVILCGCVLPREFDWYKLIERRKVEHVRNDYSGADGVTHAARIAGLYHDLLGTAGRQGMHAGLSRVHRVSTPSLACGKCASSKPGTPSVHDVDCSSIGHSDAFLSDAHCQMWWLPYLWGLDPGEHRELLRFCEDWIEASRASHRSRTLELEYELRVRRWSWCKNATISNHLSLALRNEGKSATPKDILMVFNRLATLVSDAARNSFAEATAFFLEPDYAVNAVVRGYSSDSGGRSA